MTTEDASGLRTIRASVLACLAFSLGTVAHAQAGGLLPGSTALVLLGLTLVVPCRALLARAASTRRVVALLLSGQTWVHLVLTATAGHRGDGVATGAAPRPARVDAPDVASFRGSLWELHTAQASAAGGTPEASADLSGPAAWLAHLLADATGPHAAMALLHLVAAAAVGLWLAAGERSLWALLALATTTAVATLGAVRARATTTLLALAEVPRLPGHARARAPQRRVRLPIAPLAQPQVRRGPPALLAA